MDPNESERGQINSADPEWNHVQSNEIQMISNATKRFQVNLYRCKWVQMKSNDVIEVIPPPNPLIQL